MADGWRTIHLGEQRAFYATLTPNSGVVAINSGTIIIYDNAGAPIVNDVISGSDVPGSPTQAWYIVKPLQLNLTVNGVYGLAFFLVDQAGSLITLVEPVIAFIVKPDGV